PSVVPRPLPICVLSVSLVCQFSGWAERLPDSHPSGDRNTPETELQSIIHTSRSLEKPGQLSNHRQIVVIAFRMPVRTAQPAPARPCLCASSTTWFCSLRFSVKHSQSHLVVCVCFWGLDLCLQWLRWTPRTWGLGPCCTCALALTIGYIPVPFIPAVLPPLRPTTMWGTMSYCQ
ncbi:hypothetical protein D4764_04G0003150, partial [Takifugu flavidus]